MKCKLWIFSEKYGSYAEVYWNYEYYAMEQFNRLLKMKAFL